MIDAQSGRWFGSSIQIELSRLMAAAAICFSAFVAAGCGTSAAPAEQAAGTGGTPNAAHAVRLGFYDSRAIAVAHARSPAFAQRMKSLHEEHAAAKAAGDKQRLAELDARGRAQQARLYLQGFSTAPIGDVLESIADRLPAVANDAGVSAIIPTADYNDPSVELVDVTDALVRLFEPDASTLKVITELRAKQPLAIEQAATMNPNP